MWSAVLRHPDQDHWMSGDESADEAMKHRFPGGEYAGERLVSKVSKLVQAAVSVTLHASAQYREAPALRMEQLI